MVVINGRDFLRRIDRAKRMRGDDYFWEASQLSLAVVSEVDKRRHSRVVVVSSKNSNPFPLL